jgi:aminoacylase
MKFSSTDIHFLIKGTPGHGSLLHKDTAGEKLRYLLDKFLDLRKHSQQMLENNPDLTIGDVTSANITMV